LIPPKYLFIVQAIVTAALIWNAVALHRNGRRLKAETAQSARRVAEAYRQATADIIAQAASPNWTGRLAIHKPAEGCPAGWREVADFFYEIDSGETRPACIIERPGSDENRFDYLMPREGARMVVPLSKGPRRL